MAAFITLNTPVDVVCFYSASPATGRFVAYVIISLRCLLFTQVYVVVTGPSTGYVFRSFGAHAAHLEAVRSFGRVLQA